MPRLPTIYDLMLLLSTAAPDEARAKILADVESAITGGGGSIERNDDWGRRALTFEIDDETEAEYRLIQFSGPPALLDALAHSLKIADGVVRFRIIKVRSGTPPPPDPRPLVAAPAAVTPAPATPAPVESAPVEPAPAEPASLDPAAQAASDLEPQQV